MSTDRWMDKEIVVHIHNGIFSESESHLFISDSLRPWGLYSPWNSLGQNTGVCSLSLLQRIFPTQGSNPGLPHCRQFFTSWATGKPKNIGVGRLFLLQQIFPTQESNLGLLHCRWFLYHLSHQRSSVRRFHQRWEVVRFLTFILENVQSTRFFCLFVFYWLSDQYKEKKESRLIPRFLARATIGMNLPLAKMVKTARGIRLWGLGWRSGVEF